jgi:L-threonylcarbamoyladenylate synthase
MKTQIISTTDPSAIQRGLEVLRNGGVIAFPTDTVYGIAVPVFDAAGIERLYEIKERGSLKAIAVLIGDSDQIESLACGVPEMARPLMEHFWPGPLTLVISSLPSLPANLSPGPTVGVRMPDHPFTLAFLRQSGPLATTSANLSGGENSLDASQVLDQLGGRIELILDGGKTAGGMPSTVVDCTGNTPVILRQGPISEDDLFAAIKSDNPEK